MTFSPIAGPAIPTIVGAFLLAMLIAFVVTPAIGRFVRSRAIVDRPDDPRRVHDRPIPRGGGVSVVVAFVFVGGAVLALWGTLPGTRGPVGVLTGNLIGLFGGAVLAAVIGAIDDLLDLRARWQLLGQLAVAGLAVASGVTVPYVGNPFGNDLLVIAAPIGIAFTVIWIVGMVNSLNFIDGLDGLSTGIAFIAAITLGLVSLTPQIAQPLVAILCFVLAGGLLGFLRWNFHRAVIFQGTAGVMFMGYVLAVLAILGSAKVAVALLVLAVPIIDTFWVIVRRLTTGRSPFSADRGHIHHRLLDLGMTHRATVLVIYAVCATLGGVALAGSSTIAILTFIGVLVLFGLLAFALRDRPVEAPG